MLIPHVDRQVDAHMVQGNARLLLTPMLIAEKAKVDTECGELREALDILEGQLGTGTRQYGYEDGT